MFIGEFEASLDPKGRLNLPAKIRDTLLNVFAPPLIVTVSDRCLAAYPAMQWLEKYEKLEAEPYTPERGDLLRAVSANAEECPIKNGRILIPGRLREYAGLGKSAVVAGRIKKIEIWSAESYGRLREALPPAELSERLRGLGF